MPEDFTNTATADGEGQQTVVEQVDNGDTAQATQEQAQQAERTFTQSQLDEIIKDRLGKEKQRFESNPGLTYVQKQAQRYNMSVEDYVKAVDEQERQDQLNQLVQQNIPQEYAEKLMKVDELEQWKQSIEERENQNKMYQEFLDAYPDIKGDDIPVDVWQKVQQGQNLLDAYIRHENKTLHEQLNSFQTKGQVVAANQANAQGSTGSAKGQGTPDSGFISKDVYESNKGNQGWMLKNYDSIKKSMGKWR